MPIRICALRVAMWKYPLGDDGNARGMPRRRVVVEGVVCDGAASPPPKIGGTRAKCNRPKTAVYPGRPLENTGFNCPQRQLCRIVTNKAVPMVLEWTAFSAASTYRA